MLTSDRRERKLYGYRPTTRLLSMLELLQARGRMGGPELARRLEVGERTVRRYVAMLQEMGVPVEAERGRYGAYTLRPGFRLPPMMFTDEEALALALGLLSARGLGPGAPPCGRGRRDLELGRAGAQTGEDALPGGRFRGDSEDCGSLRRRSGRCLLVHLRLLSPSGRKTPVQVGSGTLGGDARRSIRTPAGLRYTPGRSRGARGYAGGRMVRGGVAGDHGRGGARATPQDGRLARRGVRGCRHALFDLRPRVD